MGYNNNIEGEKLGGSRVADNQSIFFSGIDDLKKYDIKNNDHWTEFIVSGDIDVPELKPSIREIDSVDIKLQIVNQRVIKTPAAIDVINKTVTPVKNLQNRIITGRKLIIEGLVCASITYLSKNSDESLHTFHGFIPFSTCIVLKQFPVDGSNVDALNMSYNISTCVEGIEVKEFTDNKITLIIPLVVQANAIGFKGHVVKRRLVPKEPYSSITEEEYKANGYKNNDPIIKGICSEEKIKSVLKDSNDNLWNEICIPEILILPMYKPYIEQILSFISKVDIVRLKVINTQVASESSYEGLVLTGKKLLIEAILRQRITYTTTREREDQSIHTVHFDVPISSFIVLPGNVNLDDKFGVEACIEDIFVCGINQRRIFKNSIVFFKAIAIKCEASD